MEKVLPFISPRIVPVDENTVSIAAPADGRGIRWLTVLSAAGVAYQTRWSDDERYFLIILRFEDGERALEEITGYETASQHWPPPPPPLGEKVTETAVLAGIIVPALLILAFVKTGAVEGEWFNAPAAVLDSSAVRAGELWRLGTALALHVDVPHLTANCMCLAAFGMVVGGQLGFGTGWLGIGLAAAAGNALAVALARTPFQAVGASTAVFAALGILVTHRFLTLSRGPHREPGWSLFHRRWLPWLAGAGGLALLGTAPGSHLAGHACGFLTGLLVGAVFWRLRGLRGNGLLQHALFALFLALNILMWSFSGHETGINHAGRFNPKTISPPPCLNSSLIPRR
ncbi:MAG: rhomboid family intramembrane serine protease [Lentisphaeria bacterium]|nr:rhomboid family intramembrane serine protease [Lentisphaeria bacterium]